MLRSLVGVSKPMVHLGQLKQVVDRAGGRDGGLVMGDRQAPRTSDDEHVGEMPQDARLELLLPWIELAAALESLVLQCKRPRALEQAPRARFPVERFHRQTLVLPQLELLPCRRQAHQRLTWFNQPAVRLAKIEADEREVLYAARLHQQRRAKLQDRPEIPSGGQRVELSQLLSLILSRPSAPHAGEFRFS